MRRAVEAVRRYFTRGPRRALLRRRLLAFTSPLVALLLLVSGYLFWAYTAGRETARLFDRQDVPGLHDKARDLLGFNEIEPWKAHLAEGDAYVLEGRLPEAEQAFTQAVALADGEDSCPARINLVVVLESLADERTKAGGLAEARAKIAKAQKTIQRAPADCFTPKPHPGVGDEDLRLFAETAARLSVKADQLAHGDLHYTPRDSTYHYTPGKAAGKLETPPAPGPCPQTNDPEQTACIRNKDAPPPPPPPSQAPDQQDSGGSGADSPPPGDSASPESQPPSGAPPPHGSGSSGGSPSPGQNSGDTGVDDIGPDRLPAPGVGPVEHKLNPQSGGDPADKLKQAQADANGSGEDRE